MVTKVTVYSVVGPNLANMGGYEVPGGASYLRVSLRLLSKLNPDVFFNVKLAHWHEHGELGDFENFENMQVASHIYDDHDIPSFRFLGSVEQHGTLLNKVLDANRSIDTFSIILDPDFFVFRARIVSEMILHMEARNLVVAGVSYPARYPIEYSWKYPQVYFMICDNRKIDLTSINFRSGLEADEQPQMIGEVVSFNTMILKRVTSIDFLQKKYKKTLMLFNQLWNAYSNRALVEPKDTGWRLAEYLEGKNFEVLPNIFEAPGGHIPLFNSFVFMDENFIRDSSSLSPQSNYLLRGILNGSKFENQSVFFRYLFFPVLRASRKVVSAKWPNTSVIETSKLHTKLIYNRLSVELESADFYAFNQIPFGVHLGHKGKANLKYGLEDLESRLLVDFD
jgi:hypothetical protein